MVSAAPKATLSILKVWHDRKGMTKAENFLSKVRRLSALDSYLSSFCGGISIFTKPNDMLHVRLVQHQTATGRLAGREPNLQNMPVAAHFQSRKYLYHAGKVGISWKQTLHS